MYDETHLSPNGAYVLAASLHKPFSYLFPYERFPVKTAVLDRRGAVVKTIADEPLRDHISPEGVAPGPREVAWEPGAPATLAWAQATDGGDPDTKATDRDKIETYAAPFAGEPRDVVHTQQRIRQMSFVAGSARAVVATTNRATRMTTVALVDTAAAAPAFAELWTLRDNDRYNDPGTPMMQNGAVIRDGDDIFLRGAGYGPDGRKPFVDRMNLTTKAKTRIFQSALAPLDTPTALLDAKGTRLIIERQSPELPPNAYVREANGGMRALTAIADPVPIFRSVQRRVVTYKRPDGIDLSFTLYLPPGYKEGTALPTFLWAYPAEFNDPSVASQNTNSAQTFNAPGREAYLALAGYAVLDNASIPIIGPTRTANDTYVEQLVAGAKAAIDKAVALGVTDPNRVAVGGHSYGAFMTANLLAHSTLFAAGVAESGAYNRSLTPFGFQNERRTYWDDIDLYTKMSPFAYATSIKAPLLMIHGIKDDNTGTFPIQSERMYAAIKGNGGTARLVMLPDEAHGYLGRESIETVLAETVTWLDRFVKNAPKRAAFATPAPR
jgi:dipeptidyl aminopeptidase/acylaminoacyl peptidase